VHFVDLGESFPTSIFLQNLAIKTTIKQNTAENEPRQVRRTVRLASRDHGSIAAQPKMKMQIPVSFPHWCISLVLSSSAVNRSGNVMGHLNF
jgi:hypothetical protein